MRALYIAEFCHQIIALFRALRVQPRQTAVFGFNTDVFKIMRFVNKYRVDPEVIEKTEPFGRVCSSSQSFCSLCSIRDANLFSTIYASLYTALRMDSAICARCAFNSRSRSPRESGISEKLP